MITLSFIVRIIDVPMSSYMVQTWFKGQDSTYEWRDLNEISPYVAFAILAGEDARFCQHWGLDIHSIRTHIAAGQKGGASTISQQTVKNLFLWHGRSWARKAIEAVWTPILELSNPKKRILELYVNIAEFGPGVFGIQAASEYYFGVDAKSLSLQQTATLVSILPSPKRLSVHNPHKAQRRRIKKISEGALFVRNNNTAQCLR